MNTSTDTNVTQIPYAGMNFSYFLEALEKDEQLKRVWEKLPLEKQEEFAQYYNGQRIPNITSDPIFKHVFNPELHPERLSELLSLLLGMEVAVVSILPLENVKVSVHSKSIVLDILVQLADGSYANVEIQREAFYFTPSRAAVLSANLVSRQYSVLAGQMKSELDYEQVKNVYTIIFLEGSYPYFKNCPNDYLHKSIQTFDTGVQLDLLQNYIFVELGKFNKIVKKIDTKLDAWLKFILTKTPYDLISVINQFSTFESLYQDVFNFIKDREGMIEMLYLSMAEVDENIIRNEMKRRADSIKQMDEDIKQKDEDIKQKDEDIKQKDEDIKQKDEDIKRKDEDIKRKDESLKRQVVELNRLEQEQFKFNALCKYLVDQKRFDDLKCACENKEFAAKLITELNM